MVKIVVDTSIIIDHTRTKAGLLLDLQKMNYSGECELLVPTIVIFEFWVGRSMGSTTVQADADNFFPLFKLLI